MTTYYVGAGGNNGNNGLSWANRKLTLNGAEDVPVVAGDTVYVGPGAYREQLTVDVSGSSGNPITYIADVTGEHTDGVGGVVRITGSDDDQSATRASAIATASARTYRTFRGFMIDTCTSNHIQVANQSGNSNWIFEDCQLQSGSTNAAAILIPNNATNMTIRRCKFMGNMGAGIIISHSSTVSNAAHVVENCVFIGTRGNAAVESIRVGGITVRNCTFLSCTAAIRVTTALAGGQVLTANNNIVQNCGSGFVATTTAEFSEDYNTLFGNGTPRTNVNTGTNSVAFPALFDIPLLLDGFTLPSKEPLALGQWSWLANKTGSSHASDDLNGLDRPATNSKNSWGAIQYVAALRNTSTVRNGSSSLMVYDAGERFIMRVPVTNVSTVISLYVNRQTDYAGSNPQMIIRQPGQADRTTSDTGTANAWNQLTDTFTPAAAPGFVDIFVRSRNTATSGSFSVFVDDLTVT